jgi:hypothetical protein
VPLVVKDVLPLGLPVDVMETLPLGVALAVALPVNVELRVPDPDALPVAETELLGEVELVVVKLGVTEGVTEGVTDGKTITKEPGGTATSPTLVVDA